MCVSRLPTRELWRCPDGEFSHSASHTCCKFPKIGDWVLVEVVVATRKVQALLSCYRERY